jgi:ABC-type glycerol-3-phosphate transport system substrate-binding protein
MKTFFYSSLKILFLFFPIILLQNCSNSKDSDHKIIFWHFWSEPNQKNVLDSIIKVFEKENNCKVEVTELSWNDGKTKLMAAFNSETAPDVLELGSDWVAQFSSAGVLKELNKDSMNFANFIEFSKSPSLWNNKLYAVPWIVDTRVLFYNKEILKKVGLPIEPPESFNVILNQAPIINSMKDIYAFGANGNDSHRLYKKIVTFFWTNGGDIIDNEGNPVIDSPQNIEALNLYVLLTKNGYLETQRQIDAAFAQGKIAYWISGAWLLEKIENENPALDYGVALIPKINGKQGISFAGGEYIAINSKTKNDELSKKFVKFITDGKNAIEFCKKISEAGFPADKQYYQDPFYQKFPKRLVFAEQLKSAKMTPVIPKWLDIEELLEDAVIKSVYGEMSPAQALQLAQSKALLLIRN